MHYNVYKFLILAGAQTFDHSGYDMVEDIEIRNDFSDASRDDVEEDNENNVVHNPYYDEGDNVSDINSDAKEVVKITENPYYGGVDDVSEASESQRITVVENPYYGGIDNVSEFQR